MSNLLIFDESIRVNKLTFPSIKEKKLFIFPLTSNQRVIRSVIERCINSGFETETLETSRIINQTADKIRGRYIEFIANLPNNIRFKNKNLKEFFAHPEGGLSLWWLSLVAEKNTFKSDCFTRLAQFCSISGVIKDQNIKKVFLSTKSDKLKDSMPEFCGRNKIDYTFIPYFKSKRSIKEFFSDFDTYPYLFLRFIKWCYTKLFIMKGIDRLQSNNSKSILFITYYPNIDTELAKKGIFRNRFYSALQEELEKNEKNGIIWVALYVRRNDISFHQSLKYAKLFIKKGYPFSYLEEFLTISSFFKVFINSMRLRWRFKKIERQLPAHHFFEKDLQVYSIFSEDWNNSFCGKVCIENLVYFEAFKNMYRKLTNVDRGIYFCEMHAWEKAMLGARDFTGSEMKMLAYQHSTFSRFLLNYFNHPSEISDQEKYAIPKPNIILCDGQIPYECLKESRWPDGRLDIVEAIRFEYLKEILKGKKHSKKNILLVAFSISLEESSAILSVIHEGLKNEKDLTVWLKPHPFLSFRSILNKTGISLHNHFVIKNSSLEDILPEVKVVVINESSAAIEAVAYGCKIISINMPEIINMSQLRHVRSDFVKIVSSADELRIAVREVMEKKEEIDYEESKNLVNKFFYFNNESKKPEKFLKLLTTRLK